MSMVSPSTTEMALALIGSALTLSVERTQKRTTASFLIFVVLNDDRC
jgi:hypothetical protein